MSISGTREELEKLTGRSFKTREDVHAFVARFAATPAAERPSVRRWRTAKHATLFVLLALALIQYHLLDVLLEVMSLPSLVVFFPVGGRFL